jgi:hypothetical protein
MKLALISTHHANKRIAHQAKRFILHPSSCFITLLFCFLSRANAQNKLTITDWQQDIAVLQKELPAKHPNWFKKYSKAAFERDLAELSVGLVGKTDFEVALALQSIVAKGKDNSTRIELRTYLEKQRLIPLAFSWYADGLYLASTVKRFERAFGRKVLAVNNTPTEEVLRRLGRFCSVENESGLLKDAHTLIRFPAVLQAAGITTSDTIFLVTVAPSGQKEVIQMFPIDLRDSKQAAPLQINNKNNTPRMKPIGGPFGKIWMPEDSLLYVRYDFGISREMVLAVSGGDTATAARYPLWRTMADSIVDWMAAHPGARMLFDLRYTKDGVSDDGVAFAKRIGTISALNQPNRLFVATNIYTAEAGARITAAFRQHTNAILLGEEASSAATHWGQPQSFFLPKSGLEVRYGTMLMYEAATPDLLQAKIVLPTTFDAFKRGEDPVFEYLRKKS